MMGESVRAGERESGRAGEWESVCAAFPNPQPPTPSPHHGPCERSELVAERCIIRGYNAGPPPTATIEIVGGQGSLYTVYVSKALTAAMVANGLLASVELFDHSNPTDGVLVAVWSTI